jgi:hypothetical protein
VWEDFIRTLPLFVFPKKGGDFMAIDFFEKEVEKTQDRFNTIYGDLLVCDIRVRQRLIITICWMGVLKKRIEKAGNKEMCRVEIQQFVRLSMLLSARKADTPAAPALKLNMRLKLICLSWFAGK